MSTHISMEELYPKYKNLGPTDLILDVRTPTEFAEGHVPNAKNIPVNQIAQNPAQYAAELKNHGTVYIYCLAGGRAQTAFQIFNTLGLKNLVCVDDGGFPEWENAGYESNRG